MKKILIATLGALTVSSVFATTTTKEITAANATKFNNFLQMGWAINDPADTINIINSTLSNVTVYIAVNQNNPSAMTPKPSDPVTVTGCIGSPSHVVQPGSMIACMIQPNMTAMIQEPDAKSFKNGSSGSYSTN